MPSRSCVISASLTPRRKIALFGQSGGGEKRLIFARSSRLRVNREPGSPIPEL